MNNIDSSLSRWLAAAVIDDATAERIRYFESTRQDRPAARWPVIVAVSFGCVMVAAGVLLFVAAHWDDLSPRGRFSLVLAMVAGFHLAGALFAERHSILATALHAIGTVSLGAGIFLAAQIFNLEEHWPGGLMLWGIGALAGWWILRDWVQAAMAAILIPWWLAGEWQVRVFDVHHRGFRIEAAFLLMVAIVYFGATHGVRNNVFRRALVWIGGLAFIPQVVMLTIAGHEDAQWPYWGPSPTQLGQQLNALGWFLAIGLPLLAAYALRRKEAIVHVASVVWVGVLAHVVVLMDPEDNPTYFLWCLIGAVAMIAWGVHDARKERINMGIASFGLTVMGFYFSSVLDKFGRSTALISMGLLFLVGGWVLERTRRRLIARIEGAQA
jgi:uncharacterized membrane protein